MPEMVSVPREYLEALRAFADAFREREDGGGIGPEGPLTWQEVGNRWHAVQRTSPLADPALMLRQLVGQIDHDIPEAKFVEARRGPSALGHCIRVARKWLKQWDENPDARRIIEEQDAAPTAGR